MTLVGSHPALAATTRGVLFLAQAVLFGLLPVTLLALRPGFAAPLRQDEPARAAVGLRLQRIADGALLLAAAAAVLTLLLQAGVVAGVQQSPLDLAAVSAVLETPVGRWQALRLPLLLALGLVLHGRLRAQALRGAGDGQPSPPPSFWWVWGGLALALLATVSLTGHAVTTHPRPLYLLDDLLHLVGGAVWLAGVAVLAAVLPPAQAQLRPADQLALLSRVATPFSRLAQVAIPLVAVTGAVSSLADAGGLGALRSTGYGQALGVKVWLFLWVLAFGGYNHYWLVRRLDGAAGAEPAAAARRTLAVTVSGELAFGLLVLGATAVLVGLPPPR